MGTRSLIAVQIDGKYKVYRYDEGYEPVRIVASFNLDDLPYNETFLAAFKSEDD